MVVEVRGMSIINKMLQDLDHRQALGNGAEAAVVRPPSAAKPPHREWFWRTLAVLMLLSVVWVVWVSIQLLPRQIVTELALRAAEEARNRPPAVPETAPAAAPVEKAPEEKAQAQPAAPLAAPIPDTLKLALHLEAPVREARAEPAKPKPLKAQAQPNGAEGQKSSVDKRERTRSRSDIAETHFRQAAMLLNQARVSEAEGQLVAALQADAGHVAARQTYVALLLEQQRIEPARRQLQEALAIKPKQPTFALALARIHVESRDYAAALEVMEKAGQDKKNADIEMLRGVVLQRQGRYAGAVEAYQNAMRVGAQTGTTWLGLAISLEGLGRRPEAAEAYRRAIAAGQLTAEAREYAETRKRALE
jgi:MSHA biogenesis protein MshN